MRTNYFLFGGGIVGLCLARRLRQLGGDVRLIERSASVGGASPASAGLLERPLEPRSAFARRQAASFDGHKAFVRELEGDSGCTIAWRRLPAVHLADAAGVESGRRRCERAVERGARASWVESAQLHDRWPVLSESLGGAIHHEHSARVHPPDLLDALRAAVRREGVERIELDAGEEIETRRVAADDGRRQDVIALRGADGERRELGVGHCVLCAGAWTPELARHFGLRPPADIVPIRGQMIELQAGVELDAVLHFQDRYLFSVAPDRVWVGATVEEAGFDASVTGEGIEGLRRAAAAMVPELIDAPVVRSWAGLRPKFLQRGGPWFDAGSPAALAGHYRSGILCGPRDADHLAARLTGVPLEEFSPFKSG